MLNTQKMSRKMLTLKFLMNVKSSVKNTQEWATLSFLQCNFRIKPELKLNLSNTLKLQIFAKTSAFPCVSGRWV